MSADDRDVDLRGIGHVGRRHRDLAARRPQCSGGLVEHVGAAGDQRHPCAAVDREPGGREADAARSAGDQHVGTFQPRHRRSVRRGSPAEGSHGRHVG